MKGKKELHLNEDFMKFLRDIKGGTFFRRDTTEYFFNDIKEKDYEENGIIYPSVLIKGRDNFGGEITLNLRPYKIMNLSNVSLDKKIEKLKGTLEINSQNKAYYSEGKINDYWNGMFKIDIDSIDTNIQEYADKSVFIFRT